MKYLVKFKDGRKTTVFYEGSLNNMCFDDMGYLRGDNFIINLNVVIYIIPYEEEENEIH